MMLFQKIKQRWDIVKSWQYLFPFLGCVLLLATAYYISIRVIDNFEIRTAWAKWIVVFLMVAILYFAMLKFFLWCFEKLKNKWVTQYRWEMIAIFIVFAITGSVSGKLAAPLTHFLGLSQETTNPWLYWPVRILLIFPIYQVLLIIFGWLFGQFEFFRKFEKKMLKRMGLGFIFN